MKKLDDYCLRPESLIKDAMALIEKNKGKIGVVIDTSRVMLGTITDGDIRRALLSGSSLETPVGIVMNRDPFCADQDADRAHLFSMMQSRNIRNIPLVDKQRRLVDVINLSEYLVPERLENHVVIMAGGLGKRLLPLTESVPKPMLEIGGTPILEILISSFIAQGFYKFFISVNYLADQIKAHFGDGKQYGVQIEYLEEETPLDTAGALSLLPQRPKEALLVINGDILTNVKFKDLLDYHVAHKAELTVGVREHKVQVPYGVITLNEHEIVKFEEKPVQTYFVNTGIYALDPAALAYIRPREALTMPALLDRLQSKSKKIAAYPVTEYWLDIGRMEDFNRAEKDFMRADVK